MKFRVQSVVAWLLGSVFLYGAISKVVEAKATVEILKQVFGGGTEIMAGVLAAVVTLEFLLAYLLFYAPKKRFTLQLAFSTLIVFSAYLAYLGTLADPPDCGCGRLFKVFESNRKNAMLGVARNIVLCGAVAWLLLRRNDPETDRQEPPLSPFATEQ